MILRGGPSRAAFFVWRKKILFANQKQFNRIYRFGHYCIHDGKYSYKNILLKWDICGFIY